MENEIKKEPEMKKVFEPENYDIDEQLEEITEKSRKILIIKRNELEQKKYKLKELQQEIRKIEQLITLTTSKTKGKVGFTRGKRRSRIPRNNSF